MNLEKIDAHSHFYPTYDGPDSPIEPYITEAKKLNVQVCVASPGPCPIYRDDAQNIIVPCMWEHVEGQFHYVNKTFDPSGKVVLASLPASSNPYTNDNKRLIEEAKHNNISNSIKICVMPLHHPKLDDIQEVRDLLHTRDVVAIKLHGIATATGPEDISFEIIKALLEVDKPIVVHTDTYIKTPTIPIHNIYQKNNPIKWVRWAIDTGVKTLLTHGARLSDEAIDLAKGHDNIVIGLAPALIIMNSDKDRLSKPTTNFERDLMAKVPNSQLVFDIDYGWNVADRNKWEVKDWKMCERLDTIAEELQMSKLNLKKIYYDNSVRFFKFDDNI